jgi:hypothetical protein
VLAAVVVIGAIVAVTMLRWPGRSHPSRSPAMAMAPPDGHAAVAPAVASPKPAPATSLPARPVRAAPTSSSSAAVLTRYARTWVHVRQGRANAAASVRVLRPGESVVVDSLQGGWYLVLADQQPLGYVHRSNLGTTPPNAGP